MASSPTPADTRSHLRNVLGALAVAITDLLAEDATARGFIPAEHAAIILAGTLDCREPPSGSDRKVSS